jgi:hypothetical protein
MLIWLALVLPIIATILLWKFWNHKVVWWEFAIPFAVSILCVGIAKIGFSSMMTRDTEYHGGWVTKAEYYEDWNEYIHQTCTRQNCTGFGENQTCTTEFYDCSYVDYHPEYWYAPDSNGRGHRVSQSYWKSLCKQFTVEPNYVDLRRNFHTNDGDKYVCDFDGTFTKLEPVTTTHSYENKVQAARSVFNFEDISRKQAEELGLFEYPTKGYGLTIPCILSQAPIENLKEAEFILNKHNGVTGAAKQVRMWVLIFKEKPYDISHKQEAYWKGGNKNEIVVTVGVDKENKLEWIRTFSWTEKEYVKVGIRINALEQFKGKELDVYGVNYIGSLVLMAAENDWERKQFADFDYLTVEPPIWAVLLTFFLTLVANIGASAFVIKNQVDERRR